MRSGAQGVLSTPARPRQAAQGRPRRLYAKTPRPSQRSRREVLCPGRTNRLTAQHSRSPGFGRDAMRRAARRCTIDVLENLNGACHVEDRRPELLSHRPGPG